MKEPQGLQLTFKDPEVYLKEQISYWVGFCPWTRRKQVTDGTEVTNCSAASFLPCGFQARQVMEREFNNLLALGTDRKLDDVSACDLGPSGFGHCRFTGLKITGSALLGRMLASHGGLTPGQGGRARPCSGSDVSVKRLPQTRVGGAVCCPRSSSRLRARPWPRRVHGVPKGHLSGIRPFSSSLRPCPFSAIGTACPQPARRDPRPCSRWLLGGRREADLAK